MTVLNNFPLNELLWYKIGGEAKYLLECQTKEDIVDAFRFIQQKQIKKYFIVGLGANLLFTDNYYDGAVVRVTRTQTPQITTTNRYMTSYAGELLDTVITTAFGNNLIGLEWAGGLPSTIGAAVRGNVGAFGGEIKDTLESAEVLKFENNEFSIFPIGNNSLNFAYRNSNIKQDRALIVLSATFALKDADQVVVDQAKQEYLEHINYRNTHHPHEYPNTGSCFKNITEPEKVQKVISVFPDMKKLVDTKWHGKVAIGYVNSKLKLTGLKIGGAKVSEIHGNFIDNLGDAKQLDVLAIIRTVQKKYLDMFGFSPEPEVEIVL